MKSQSTLLGATAAMSFLLTACGGGGGGVASIPPPPPPPEPPPQSATVTIFANPAPQTFATVGVAATKTGSGSSMGFNNLTSADAAQVHIRYTSGGFYEIQMPGADWDRLIIAKGVIPADPENANTFQPASAPQNDAGLVTRLSKTDGYKYSEIAGWFDSSGRFGEMAFGEATPAGQLPQTGSAVYHGVVAGTSDVVGHDFFDGYYRTPVDGAVSLSFDFGKSSLSGSMTVGLNAYGNTTSLGTFAFEDTVLSASSGMYSGKFNTSAHGDNFFLGQFTGPHGEETIGAWALPFVFTDGLNHQAFGAWIAKQ